MLASKSINFAKKLRQGQEMNSRSKRLPATALLRSIFEYDKDAGILKWNVDRVKVKPGDPAGALHPSGHLTVGIDGKYYLVHRIIWAIVYGKSPDGEIDHRNGIGSDNRIDNLRIASISQNNMNRGIQKNNKSGYKGVYWKEPNKRWVASIRVNNKLINLGGFDTPQDAHRAYAEAAHRFFGDFARTS